MADYSIRTLIGLTSGPPIHYVGPSTTEYWNTAVGISMAQRAQREGLRPFPTPATYMEKEKYIHLSSDIESGKGRPECGEEDKDKIARCLNLEAFQAAASDYEGQSERMPRRFILEYPPCPRCIEILEEVLLT